MKQQKEQQKVNIYTVAQEAGVSIATVSRVINHSASVSEKSKRKVLEVIRRWNYVPNEGARNLSTSNSTSVGVVLPDVENRFFMQLLRGILLAADEADYNVVLFDSINSLEREHGVLDTIRKLQLCGIIFVAVSYADWETIQKLKDFESYGIPVVLLDRELIASDFARVVSDDEEGSFQAVTELIRQGHRKIGMIAGPGNVYTVFNRLNGFYRATREAGIVIPADYIRRADFSMDSGWKEAEALCHLPDPPTAIFSFNYDITYGCIKAFRDLDWTIGKDIAFIGFDDVEELKWTHANISAVSRDVPQMGRLAMQQLVRRMSGEKIEAEDLVITVPTKLILRGSEKFCPEMMKRKHP